MTGSVIQTAGNTKFGDDLKQSNKSRDGNSLQRVFTLPDINAIIDCRGSSAILPLTFAELPSVSPWDIRSPELF